jgi:hypothetical protein
MFELQDLFKYALEGIAVAIAAYYLTGKRTALREVLMLGLAAAAAMIVLDTFAPGVAMGARHGAGFGIGFNLVGGGNSNQ